MQDIIKQWPILSLLPMCTTDAGLSIIISTCIARVPVLPDSVVSNNVCPLMLRLVITNELHDPSDAFFLFRSTTILTSFITLCSIADLSGVQ